MFVHKLGNILYHHLHTNFSRKCLLFPCMAKKFTDKSWTIHHSEKCGEKNQISIDKWIIKVMYSFSESESEICSVLSDSLRPHGIYSPWNSPGQKMSGLPFPSPGDIPNPGIKPGSPTLQVDSLPSEPPGKPKLPGRPKQLMVCLTQKHRIKIHQSQHRHLLHHFVVLLFT